jgi:hypothetical protein
VWGNSIVDIIADAAKRQAPIEGQYIEMPMATERRFTIVPNEGTSHQQKSIMARRQEHIRDMPSTADLILNAGTKSFSQRISSIFYGGQANVRLYDDDDLNVYKHRTGMHLRAGHCIRSIQELINRPDVYGESPLCPACEKRISHGWYHLLTDCEPVKEVINTWRRKVGNLSYSILYESEMIKRGGSNVLIQTPRYQFEEIRFPCKCKITRLRKDCAAADQVHRPSVEIQHSYVDGQETELNEDRLMEVSVARMMLESPLFHEQWKSTFHDNLALNPCLFVAIKGIFHRANEVNPDNYKLLPRYGESDGISTPHPKLTGEWRTVVACKMENSWFSENRRMGKECQHAQQRKTTGGVLALNEDGRAEWTNVALADFRPFYQELVLGDMRRRQGQIPQEKLLWMPNDVRAGPYLRTPYIGTIPDCRYRFRLPMEELSDNEACSQFWLGHNPRGILNLYRGLEGQGKVRSQLFLEFIKLADKLDKLIRPNLGAYKRSQLVTYNLLRVLTHLNEWRKDSFPIAYVDLPREERLQVLDNLKINRARQAQNQETERVRPVRLK